MPPIPLQSAWSQGDDSGGDSTKGDIPESPTSSETASAASWICLAKFCAAISSLRIKSTGDLTQREFTSMAPARVSAAPPRLTCVTIKNSVREGSPGTARMKFPATRISLRTYWSDLGAAGCSTGRETCARVPSLRVLKCTSVQKSRA